MSLGELAAEMVRLEGEVAAIKAKHQEAAGYFAAKMGTKESPEPIRESPRAPAKPAKAKPGQRVRRSVADVNAYLFKLMIALTDFQGDSKDFTRAEFIEYEKMSEAQVTELENYWKHLQDAGYCKAHGLDHMVKRANEGSGPRNARFKVVKVH